MMKLRILILFFLVLYPSQIIFSQISSDEAPQILGTLFERLSVNHEDIDRLRINDSIVLAVECYIKSDSLLNKNFDDLRYLGQIISPDSAIKIISWNLNLRNEPGRYYCYILKKTGTIKNKKIYKLTSTYKDESIKTDEPYNQNNWYGALYYDIRPFVSDGEKYWIILGIDYGNMNISRKLIDVMSFTPDDSIVFGKKLFISDKDTRQRVVFEYSSEATMTLRFRSDNSIVFDHLVPFSSSHKDDYQYYGPDYSYDEYDQVQGFWKMKVNVDIRNKE